MKHIPATVGLEEFTVMMRIGVGDDERSKLQPVRIRIDCQTDIGNACRSDQIGETVDYSLIRREVVALANKARFHLLERLAGEILSICFNRPGVSACRVRIKKVAVFRDAVPFVQTSWIKRGSYAKILPEAAE